MILRTATSADLAALTVVERACFPPAEAATEQQLAERLRVYPHHFWLLEDDGKLVAFLDGMATDEPTIQDEMFANVSMHNEQGAWQTIFGLNTLPEYRRLCRTAAGGHDGGCQGRRTPGLHFDLQGADAALLRKIRLPESGSVPLRPRRCRMV